MFPGRRFQVDWATLTKVWKTPSFAPPTQAVCVCICCQSHHTQMSQRSRDSFMYEPVYLHLATHRAVSTISAQRTAAARRWACGTSFRSSCRRGGPSTLLRSFSFIRLRGTGSLPSRCGPAPPTLVPSCLAVRLSPPSCHTKADPSLPTAEARRHTEPRVPTLRSAARSR